MQTDIFIIGGGINGTGIARDAAGRGLSVTLAEMGDLAHGTSSRSTKLFHGGLRYLEYFEIKLVAKALAERETLLRAMPHIAWPMRFVLPLSPEMRFDNTTPAAKLLKWIMPWARGRRPNLLIRLGLFFYDSLGGRKILPATRSVDLARGPFGRALAPRFAKGYEYSDVWVNDARLVALNARDAAQLGAQILVQTRVISAVRSFAAGIGDFWTILTDGPQGQQTHTARVLINAGGPWVSRVVADTLHLHTREHVRLVRGSHIITRKLYDHDRCYFLQGSDGRIMFLIPYEQDFTLIGTTDADHMGDPNDAACTEAERDYLISFANSYLAQPISAADVVWSYAGVRPLYDDGAGAAQALTRDYVLSLNARGAPLLNIFGGKITTYRRLAQEALAKLTPFLQMGPDWTAGAPLPGGDFAHDGAADLTADLQARFGFLTPQWAVRLIRAYGTDAAKLLGSAQNLADLGVDFGATLYEAEVKWMMVHEFARSAQDVLWRRSKLGLHMDSAQIAGLADWMAGQ